MNKPALALILLTGLMFAACNGSSSQSKNDSLKLSSFGANSNSNVLLGAGVTFSNPLPSKLFAEYNKEAHVMVDYQSIGAEGGISQLINKGVDFIFTDKALNDAQQKKISSPVLEIPLCGAPKTSTGTGGGLIKLLIYKEQNYSGRNLPRAQKLLKFIWWEVHEGQKYCKDFSYTPLAPSDLAIAEKALKSATFNGKPLL